VVGNTLRDIRERIDALRADDGRFYLVCARTGERPIPVADARFDSRAAAVEAARVAEEYRSALRRYDPTLGFRDLIVCEDQWISADGVRADSEDLLSFCHDVAGVFLETLSERGYDDVERAVFDDYLDAAEVADRDELCLELLRSLVDALDRHLTASERASLVASAAERLPSPGPGDPDQSILRVSSPSGTAERPVESALARLRDVDLIAGYSVTGTRGNARTWSVTLSEYALAGEEFRGSIAAGEDPDARLPTLPLVVDLLRRVPESDVAVGDATVTEDGWRLSVSTGAATPTGLVSVAVNDVV